MNIFYTNDNPLLTARDHCLVLQNKMIIEHCQLLSTAHHVLDGDQAIDGIYKKTHHLHPSTVWCRSSVYHYEWLLDCTGELLRLYSERTGKVHGSHSTFERLQTLPKHIKDVDFVPPPVAAPDQFKALAVFDPFKAPLAYQRYLNYKFKEWLSRDKPIKVQFHQKAPGWLDVELLNKINVLV
jgi:hypothetical protein